jgi:hypothetical protein
MTTDQAIIFANEANVTQRTFGECLPSEKAKSIYQYHAAIKRQGERNDLADTSGDNRQKSSECARDKTSRVYQVSTNTVRLYLNLYRLIEPLQKRLDTKEFGTTPAQKLSLVPETIQEIVNDVLDEDSDSCTISVENARKIRDSYKGYKADKTEDKATVKANIRTILAKKHLGSEPEQIPDFTVVQISALQYKRLFADTAAADVEAEIIEAVEFYRKIPHGQ